MVQTTKKSKCVQISAQKNKIVYELLVKLYGLDKGWIGALRQEMSITMGQISTSFLSSDIAEADSRIGAFGVQRVMKILKKHFAKPFASLDMPIHSSPCKGVSICTYPCYLCTKEFNSVQQLSLHLFKSHNIKDPIRLQVESTFCCFCMLPDGA